MTKKILAGIAMSLLLASSASAVDKIVKIDSFAHNIAPDTQHSWKSPKFIRHIAENASKQESDVILGPTEGYSLITGPDGSQWYATQTYTSENYYYSASTITVFNGRGEQQGVINVEIPEGQNVNQIIVDDVVSTTLFDKDANTMELPVIFHNILAPGKTSYTTNIYDIASGQLKATYEGRMVLMSYNTGYRNEWIGILSSDSIADGHSYARYDIYTKPGYSSDNATLKHTFAVPTSLAEYQIGSVLNVFFMDHKPYYTVSHYEKEYLDPASYEEPWDMIPTADNHFITTIFDQNCKEIGMIKVPVVSTPQKLMQFGIGLLGIQDFSKNYWDSSNNMQLVVTTSIFNVVSESENVSISVYDLKGNHVKDIATEISDWMRMYDVPGQPTQLAMLSADGTALSMVNVPECETVITFGNEVEGEPISTNIDRYAVGAGYQYIVALPTPEVDSEKNFIQRFAWITTEGEIANQVKFNLGKSNASWIPLVMGEVMNPYVFDTDDMREYVFIANQYVSGTTGKITDELRIVKEDGTEVRTYKEDATKGDLGICNIVGFNDGLPAIIVPYLNSSTDLCTVEIDFLPYNKFSAGGDGSVETPYLISSLGDMALIGRDLSANYKIIKDFDAAEFGEWEPLGLFTGTLDGDNHTISNLYISGNSSYPSIFAETENASVTNLRLASPEIYASDNAMSIGLIAANAISSNFSNIQVFDAIIEADADAFATIGGIVGSAALNSTISECYNANTYINAPGASPVGAIAGDTRTTSNIEACAASGSINAGKTIGGIVGEASTACSTTNCHSIVSITGKHTIGGIAGYADRGGIHACLAEGSLTATQAAFSNYINVGGIVGSLAAFYGEISTDTDNGETAANPWNNMVISNNVVNIADIEATGNAVHRIIGHSRWDEDIEAQKYDKTVIPTMDAAIDKNYAVLPSQAIENDISAEVNTTEGATLMPEEFTAEFLTALNFNFGTTASAPWALIDNAFGLYFEDDCQSGIDDIAADSNRLIYNGSEIIAGKDSVIELFNISGIKVADANGTLNVDGLHKGIYIATATNSNGEKQTTKIIVK